MLFFVTASHWSQQAGDETLQKGTKFTVPKMLSVIPSKSMSFVSFLSFVPAFLSLFPSREMVNPLQNKEEGCNVSSSALKIITFSGWNRLAFDSLEAREIVEHQGPETSTYFNKQHDCFMRPSRVQSPAPHDTCA